MNILSKQEDMLTETRLKTIEKDSIEKYQHVLSQLKEDVKLKGSEKRISYRFGVTVFPTRLLVDKTGLIIGRWEGDTQLNTNELKAIFQKEF